MEILTRRNLFGLGLTVGAASLLPAVAAAAVRKAPRLTPLPNATRDGVLVWNVSPVDYRADEYALSGEADVLESVSMADAVDMSKRDSQADLARRSFDRKVVSAAQPYATRLVIYRPADPRRFSGRVVLEVLHPSNGGSSIVWGQSHALLAARGDAYIGIQPPLTVQGLKQVAPTRYAALRAVHPTQLWDALIDAAILARTREGLLGSRRARHVILAGYSYTGVATASFANFHHHRARAANGRPLIDGYMPLACATFVRPLDVPVMRLNTQGDFNALGGLANRNPDSDSRIGRMRHYELTGSAHSTAPFTSPLQPPANKVPERRGLPQFTPAACYAGFPSGSRPNDFPVHVVIDGMIANMFAWIEQGVAPPRAPRIAVNSAGGAQLDADGNALGGLRLPLISVPVATYGVGKDSCFLFGFTSPFPETRKRALHGSKAAYLSKFRDASEDVRRQGFVTDAGRETLIAMAASTPEF